MLLAGKFTALVTALVLVVSVAARPLAQGDRKRIITSVGFPKSDGMGGPMNDWIKANPNSGGVVDRATMIEYALLSTGDEAGADVWKRLIASVGLPKDTEVVHENRATVIEYGLASGGGEDAH
ncbi:hypothetical protein C8J57DRAFT_1361810 [Mycena rebaudengoi]|nr:hypothetical protein C8J57DRAFT_1361810 [Mycena rebaudengoi]